MLFNYWIELSSQVYSLRDRASAMFHESTPCVYFARYFPLNIFRFLLNGHTCWRLSLQVFFDGTFSSIVRVNDVLFLCLHFVLASSFSTETCNRSKLATVCSKSIKSWGLFLSLTREKRGSMHLFLLPWVR